MAERITRQLIYARVERLQQAGHDLSVESHGEPRRIYFHNKAGDRLLQAGLTPGEAAVWLSGFVEGIYTERGGKQ